MGHSLAMAYGMKRRNMAQGGRCYADGGNVENEDLDPQFDSSKVAGDEVSGLQHISKARQDAFMAHGGSVNKSQRLAAMEHNDGSMGQHDSCVGMYAKGGLIHKLMAKRMAMGGIADTQEHLGDGNMNSGHMDDNFLSEDSSPFDDAVDEDGINESGAGEEQSPEMRRKGILIHIMNGLHDKHYGRS